MNALHADTTSPLHDSAPSAPCVLLVSEDESCLREIEQLLRRIEPQCRLLIESGAIDALLAATYARPDLVLIDARTGACAAALRRNLAQLTPGATVLVFDASVPPVAASGALPCTEAPALCERWFEWFRGFGRTRRGEPGEGGEGGEA